MIEHLSASQINLYLQCSLKYKFQHIDEIPKPFKPSSLAFGSVMHSTLSWFHKERMYKRDVSLEKLYKIFDTDWFAQKVDTEIRYKEGDNEMKLIIMAKEMLGLYFHSPIKEILGAEVPFLVPLVNPSTKENLGIPLVGMIDLVEKDDVIVEFKTSNQTISNRDVGDYLQLTAYSYAYEMLYQKTPKLLKVVNFVKTKKPKMNILETKRDKRDYERLFYLASQVVSGIKNRIFFPRPSFWCKDCEYEEYCKAWEGN